ncbi:hypothetical protein BH11ACT8_BH11ACT8_30750 [soil metagenome]
MTDVPLPEQGSLEYHQLHRAGRDGWWWSLLGAVAMIVLFAVVGPLLVTIPFAAYLFVKYGVGNGPGEGGTRLTDLADTTQVTPSVLLYVFVLLIVALPASWLVQRAVSGLRPRWLASVAPRIRWRWLAVSFGVAVVALVVAIVLGSVLPSGSEDLSTSGGANSFTSTSLDFLIIIVLCVPLQATAEEYVFRGYLTQAFGSLVPWQWPARVIAVVVPALIFAAFHGLGQSLPIFFDRFAFGIVAGILVIVTGGLEAGIAYHVVNNLLAFGITVFFGDMTDALNPTGGGWTDVLVSFVKSLIFVGLSIAAARKMGVQTRSDPRVLVAPAARV